MKVPPSQRRVADGISFFCFPFKFRRSSLVIGVLKLLQSSPHGTCQMLCEQLAYQTITVMVDCPLWFQHVCGLTNFAHTLESQVNNRLFFWVQLSDFGKEGRRRRKKKASARVQSHDLSSELQPSFDIRLHVQSWALASRVNWGLTSLLCLGADKKSVSEVGSRFTLPSLTLFTAQDAGTHAQI